MSGLESAARSWLSLLGRILISVIFIISGAGKIFNFAGTAEVMAGKGLPIPQALLAVTIIIELGGALMILAGWHARPAAAVMFLWLIPVTLVFHRFWGIDAAAAQGQRIHFLKNLAIMGAMAHVAAFGPGPLSLRNDG